MKTYDVITAKIRSVLLADSNILDWDGWETTSTPIIYPAYIEFYDNPVYPALTICRDFGETNKSITSYEKLRYYIHGWFKQTDTDTTKTYSVDDCAYLMNMVVNALDADPIYGQKVSDFSMCRKIDSQCPLYDSSTRTTFFMTQWLIQANKNLIND